jgi:hypothetical protein
MTLFIITMFNVFAYLTEAMSAVMLLYGRGNVE